MQLLTTSLKWAASISGILAAMMVALDSGRRVTGWGFVIFVGSSFAWIAGAVLARDGALGTQNAALLAINLFGVYRYLIRYGPARAVPIVPSGPRSEPQCAIVRWCD